MAHAIAVEQLVKVYPRRGAAALRAVDGLDFDVARGSIFGLLGPNGAGKTTHAAASSRRSCGRRPGSASVLGHDVVAAPLDVRRRHLGRDPGDTAASCFCRCATTSSPSRGSTACATRRSGARAERVMERLRPRRTEADRKVQDLSGGFRRRVQVAKVFMVETPVVFLDEFSTGMDPILKRAVMELLREEARTRPDHRPDDADPERGGGAVRRHPDHQPRPSGGARRSARAEAAVGGRLRGRAHLRSRCRAGSRRSWRRCGRIRVLVTQQHRRASTLKEDEARVLALVSALAGRGRVLRLEIGGASLEDIFVELTGKPASA